MTPGGEMGGEAGRKPELDDNVNTGEEVTDETLGKLVFAKDSEDKAQPIAATGQKKDQLKVEEPTAIELLEQILIELKKTNLYLAELSDLNINEQDTDVE